MKKEDVQKGLQELKETAPKRNFTQSYDVIINLKNFSTKQNPIDFFVTLPHPTGKKIKVAAFVDQQLGEQAEKHCDLVLREADFAKYKDPKDAKKLAKEYDYFIAQANLMPKVAAAFGKQLGGKGKMPNPKLGCVVPPNADLEALRKKLEATARLIAKKGMNLQAMIAKENLSEEDVIENAMALYQALLKNVPNEEQNVKEILLKLTMSKPIKIS